MTKPRFADAAKVRPGEDLDWPRVAAYLKAELPGLDGELEVLQFPNGSANLTYLLRFGDRPLVLRRPPFGRLAPGAHDMAREYRVLSRLWRAFPPAPRALLLCEDHSVAGATFFVMEFRAGTVIWDQLPEPMRRHPDAARRVLRRRRRPRRPAPGRLRRLRPGRPRPARRLRHPAGPRLAEPVGGGRPRRRRDGAAAHAGGRGHA